MDNGGEIWSIDGVDDQGFGDAVVYSRVGVAKAGAVESTLLPNFSRTSKPSRLTDLAITFAVSATTER